MKFGTSVALLLVVLSQSESAYAFQQHFRATSASTSAFRRVAQTVSAVPSSASASSSVLFSTTNGEATTTDAPFTVETTNTGPAEGPVHTLRFHNVPGQSADIPNVTIETGKIGRQAAGAVTLTRGDTIIYSTACRDEKPKEEIDFLPLSVDYQERFSSAGLTSGAFNKRDGRPAEHEILTCRLIDRPLRPLIQAGWRHETQLLSWVLSYDGERSCDPLAIISSAASLYLSDVPLAKPVAAVQVGMDVETGAFILDPTHEQMAVSKLHLIIAGTEDAVLMIEGSAEFLSEETMINAVQFGHQAVKVYCQGLQALNEAVGVTKNYSTIATPPETLQARVDEIMMARIDDMYNIAGKKKDLSTVMSTLSKAVVEELIEEFPDEKIAIKGAFKNLLSRRMYHLAKTDNVRVDGRNLDQIRRLDMIAGFLPRVHGSALFTRGETQTIATTTLGDASMQQKIDGVTGMKKKRFYLQYTFPPCSVAETGRVGAAGRREVGHGALAEKAIIPTLPSEADFPYTIRAESLITESNGSSSMASVCGVSLALMDAGVPVKSSVAGIAMGMLINDKGGVSDEDAIILSDITGTEDGLGMMDFKVAGDRSGITTFQLDIKCEGLTVETMARALEQARVGRLHLLDEMDKTLAGPRSVLPDTVPKMLTFSVSPDTIGKVIGPGGKQIRAVIEDFALVGMDVKEDGSVQISSYDQEKLKEAEAFVMGLVAGGGGRGGGGDRKERVQYAGPDPVEGETYTGKITGIHAFGVFVEILPGAEDGSTPGLEGLVHVSELSRERIRNCEGYVKSMGVEELTVKYIGMDRGKIKLSRKALMPGGEDKPKQEAAAPSGPPPTMSDEEVDVIAQAIEGLRDI
jgi:polyribonucleotide nucleotidyltransferase